MDGGAPVGVRDSVVVAVDVAGGVSAGLLPPGLGIPSSGVGLRSSGVGEAEPVAVEVGVGVAVGGCATETAAPTTVSRAAAAQMIWTRRRKLATMRRRSAAMECDYRPGADGRGLPPSKWWCGAAVRPTEPATEGGPKSPRGGAQHLDFAHSRRTDVISRVRSGRRLAARSQPGPGSSICPNAGAADLGALDLMRAFWGLASRHSIGGDHDATNAHVSRAWHDPGVDVVSVRRGAERAGGYRLGSGRLLAGPVAKIYQPDYVSDFAVTSAVNIYEVQNNGNWYDFGFMLGVAAAFGGGAGGGSASAGGVRRRRRASGS